MLEEQIENRGPFIKQPQNSEPMTSAEQWLMSPLLDSYLKIQSLKHIGIGEGKNGSTEANIELRNKLKYKQEFRSQGQWGKD